MDREDALDALAIGNLADGEALVQPAAVARDHNAFIGLNARALAFLHLDVDDHRISRPKLGDFLALDKLGGMFRLELLDNVHNENSCRFVLAVGADERFGTLF